MCIKTISSVFLISVFLCSCGQENPYCEGSAENLPEYLLAQYEEFLECAQLVADIPLPADPPFLKRAPAVECPDPQPSGNQRCCIAGEEQRPCRDRPERLCGRRGLYVHECKTVILPEGCDVAFRHEIGHHLLYQSGQDGGDENSPIIRQCEWR